MMKDDHRTLKASLNPRLFHGVNDESERPLSPEVFIQVGDANADDKGWSKQPGRHEKQPVESAVMSPFDKRCFEDAADEQEKSRRQTQQQKRRMPPTRALLWRRCCL
jgi:hypothetical protein